MKPIFVIRIRPDPSRAWETMRFLDTGKPISFPTRKEAQRRLKGLMVRFPGYEAEIVEAAEPSPLHPP
jgi:hypothetical protein